jgi:ribonucleoside-triphosphate reductase
MPTPEEQKAEDDRIATEAEKKNAEESNAAERDKTEHMIPKSRFDEVNREKNELKNRLTAIEKANKEAEEKRLIENQEFQKLAEKLKVELEGLKPKAAIAEESEKTLMGVLEAQIAEIPEQMRGLIPEEMTTIQKLNWLSKNKTLLLKPKAFDIGAGKNGGGAPETVDLSQEEVQMANKFGMKPDEYAKYK